MVRGIYGLPYQGTPELNNRPTHTLFPHPSSSMQAPQSTPHLQKNLFTSKKKTALSSKENFWEASPLKTTPKYQLLGKYSGSGNIQCTS